MAEANAADASLLYPQIFLAMAHYKLGHAGEARRWLAEVRSGIATEPLEKMSLWYRRATVEVLLGEARHLIPKDE